MGILQDFAAKHSGKSPLFDSPGAQFDSSKTIRTIETPLEIFRPFNTSPNINFYKFLQIPKKIVFHVVLPVTLISYPQVIVF